MKRNAILLSLLGCLSSCMYQHYVESNHYSISKVPIVPHQNPVEVFLQGETPKEEYFKISSLTVSSQSNSLDKMLAEAQKKSQSIGYDGIIIVDITAKTGYARPKQSISYDQSRMAGTTGKDRQYYQDIINSRIADGSYQEKPYSYQELTVMGIKYKKNVNYLDKFLKAEHFYTDSTQKQPTASFYYDFNGTTTRKDYDSNSNFLIQFNRFDPDFLLKSKPRWEYRQDNYGHVTHRRYMRKDFPLKSCKLVYNEKAQVVMVSINESYPLKGEEANYDMKLGYTSKGDILSVKVYTHISKKLIEQRDYLYQNNKYIGKTIKIYHGTPKQYLVKAEYYTNDMLSVLEAK